MIDPHPVALRLAQVLEVPVEEPFSIEMPVSASEKSTPVDLLMGPAKSGQPDQLVRFAKVGRRIIGVPSLPVLGELPAADAVIVGPGKGGKILVRQFHDEDDAKNRLIVAGCDPAMPVKFFRQVRDSDPPSLNPDITVTRPFADFLAGRDPALDVALGRSRK